MNDISIPDDVPIARPVSLEGEEATGLPMSDIPTIPTWPVPVSRLRAVVELFIFLVFSLLVSWVAYVLTTKLPLADERWQQVIGNAGVGIFFILACFVIVRVAGHKPVAIGWTCKDLSANAVIGTIAWVGTYIFICFALVTTWFIFPEWMPKTPEAQEAIEKYFPPMRLYWVIPSTVIAVLWEELFFRGILLTRLYAIFKRWWLTVLIGAIVFGTFHSYQGHLAMWMTGFLGLVMGTLFVWRRSLVPPLVFHTLHNLFMFTLLYTISQTWE